MDFDVIDDSRPRFQVQSGSRGEDEEETRAALNKVHAGVCASVGMGVIGLGLSLVAGLLQFVVIWVGVSLMLGPFAPSSITGGDCRVGVGEPVLPEVDQDSGDEQIVGNRSAAHPREKQFPRKAAEVVNGTEIGLGFRQANGEQIDGGPSAAGSSIREKGPSSAAEEPEWGSEDVELLKKAMAKHPRGSLRRWEVIAEALGWRYRVESVVKMSKALGQRKTGAGGEQQAYDKFLSQRKNLDVAIASPRSLREEDGDDAVAAGASDGAAAGGGNGRWTEGEDKALLTALKTFPKDSPMRWDKVAQALPGRSKAQCFKRFADLRKSYRSTVGGSSGLGDGAED